ncbi:hypothetical protein DYH09_00960 [bacterium CPR1]|nr:hypothetical protein [bacterium CPR1]
MFPELIWPAAGLLLAALLLRSAFRWPALLVGLAGLAWGGYLLVSPSEIERRLASLPEPQARALAWVSRQMVPGETCLSQPENGVLPAPHLHPDQLKAFRATGRVELLGSSCRWLILPAHQSPELQSGLKSSKRWLRAGPTFEGLQTYEILTIPRAAAPSQPPFRSSLQLAPGPYRGGQVVAMRLDLYNATFETRRPGWIRVQVYREGQPLEPALERLAGFTPLPARSGDVIDLVLVAPEQPGDYEVSIAMPHTMDGKPLELFRKSFSVRAAGAP